jgi:hypothetical protein
MMNSRAMILAAILGISTPAIIGIGKIILNRVLEEIKN